MYFLLHVVSLCSRPFGMAMPSSTLLEGPVAKVRGTARS